MMKILAYNNPFSIDECDFWDDIKKYPQLCASQTLIQGMQGYYPLAELPYLVTIDKYIEKFYGDWKGSIERQIKQHTSFSPEIDKINNSNLKNAFRFNQRELLEATRMLVELDISPDCMDENNLNLSKEQREFIRIYKNSINRSEGSTWNIDRVEDPLEVFISLINKDLNRIMETDPGKGLIAKIKKDKKIQYLSRNKEYILSSDLEGIVIHGVHRFSPIILRLIEDLRDVFELNIYFLINYHPYYKKIYKTWDKVYEWTGCLIDPYTNSFEGNKVGKAYGDLLNEGRAESLDDLVADGNLEFIKYDNMTHFADRVKNVFENAKKEFSEKGGNHNFNPLSLMSEHFYSPNNIEINNLLQSYFPDQFGDKPFLSYPIGQFILGLYNMWDERSQSIIIDESSLRECLFFFRAHKDLSALEIYDKIKSYFVEFRSFKEFMSELKRLINRVRKFENGSLSNYELYKKFSFYNISSESLLFFEKVMNLIQNINNELFVNNTNGYINFKIHFQKLISILNQEDIKGQMKDEAKKILDELILKFENINQLDFDGTISDLRESLHYYFSIKQENEDPDWIVRNFEQIDGGVLLSREAKRGRISGGYKNRTYHLALLSDDKMNISVNDQLPWPLDEEFFQYALNENVPERLMIFKECMKEYKNFLRYSLFYATYYLKTKIALSYVELSEGDTVEPYYLLQMLGLEPEKASEYEDPIFMENVLNRYQVLSVEYGENDLELLDHQTFSICPYRFLLNKFLDNELSFNNSYHQAIAFWVLLFELSWRKLEGRPKSEIEDVVKETCQEIKDKFPNWKDINFIDFISKVSNYMEDNEVENGYVKQLDDYYLKIRHNFLYAQLKEDWNNTENLLDLFQFSPRRYKRNNNIKKSIERINEYLKENKDFLKKNDIKYPEKEVVCQHCNQVDLCMRAYSKE